MYIDSDFSTLTNEIVLVYMKIPECNSFWYVGLESTNFQHFDQWNCFSM